MANVFHRDLGCFTAVSESQKIWRPDLESSPTDVECLQTAGARFPGLRWQLCLWWYKAAANPLVLPGSMRLGVPHIARAHQWALPSELPVLMELGWMSPEKRGPVWDYQHSLLPCITLAPGSASRKTLCKSEQKENIMWEEIARLLFKCQRDSDLFWVLEEMWERDICQILGLPIWLLWTTFLFLLSP